jgi:serine/threonine protein kinase/tetratricopeptide (TPR) repeat protein
MGNETHQDMQSLSGQLQEMLAAHGADPTLVDVFADAMREPDLTMEELANRLAGAATVVDLQQEKSTAEMRRDGGSLGKPVNSPENAGDSKRAKTVAELTAPDLTVADLTLADSADSSLSVAGLTVATGATGELTAVDAQSPSVERDDTGRSDVEGDVFEVPQSKRKKADGQDAQETEVLADVDSLFHDAGAPATLISGNFDLHDSFDAGFESPETQDDASQIPTKQPETIESVNQRTRPDGVSMREGETALQRGSVQAMHDYRVHKKHAEGGLGAVYLAQDEALQRFVALKEMKPKFARNQKLKNRFLLEAQVTARLDHPSIAPVYQLGFNPDGSPFYTMKFIVGQTLQTKIKKLHQDRKEISKADWNDRLKALLRPFINSCHALGFAHANGILHRDIKPENIMLGEFGESIVVDWGLAKVIDNSGQETIVDVQVDDDQDEFDFGNRANSKSVNLQSNSNALGGGHGSTFKTFVSTEHTQDGHVSGTLAYMSPEQILGQQSKLNATSDIYSLGATLYTMLTGRTPVKEKTVAEYTRRICEQDIERPQAVNPWAPRALVAICDKAMSVEQTDRYPSIQEMIDDLEAWLDDRPISAVADSPWSTAARWLRRNRTVARVGFLALLLTTLTATVSCFLVDRARNVAEDALVSERVALVAETQALENEQAARLQTRKALDTVTDGVIGELLARQSSLTPQDRSFLETVLLQYDQLANAKGGSDSERYFQAQGKFRIGDIHKQLGDLDEAATAYHSALSTLKLVSPSDETQRLTGQIRNNLGGVYEQQGDSNAAQVCYQSAVNVLQRIVTDASENELRLDLAGAMNNLGNVFWRLGDKEIAAENIEGALKLLSDASAQEAPLTRIQILTNYAGLLRTGDQLASSESFAREAVDLWDNLANGGAENSRQRFATPNSRMTGVLARTELATSLFKTENYADAVRQLKMAVDEQDALVKQFPQRTAYQRQLNRSKLKLGQNLDALGHPAAGNFLETAETGTRSLATRFPSQNVFRTDLAFALETIGAARVTRKKKTAIQKLVQAEKLRHELFDLEPDNRQLINDWLATRLNLANEYRLGEKYADAQRIYEAVCKAVAQRPAEERREMAELEHKALLGRADSLSRQGKHGLALSVWETLAKDQQHPEWNVYELQRILCLLRTGKIDAGLQAVQRLQVGGLRNLNPTDHYDIACCYSVAIEETQARDRKFERKFDKAELIRLCIAALQSAHAAGFFENEVLASAFAKDRDLIAISGSAEFQGFLDEHRLKYRPKEQGRIEN